MSGTEFRRTDCFYVQEYKKKLVVLSAVSHGSRATTRKRRKKRVMQAQSCCFARLNLSPLFAVLVAVAVVVA